MAQCFYVDMRGQEVPCYHHFMLLDGVPASHIFDKGSKSDRAIASFLSFIEKKLRVSILRDARNSPQDLALLEPLHIAQKLMDLGVLKSFGRSSSLSDEPRLKAWFADTGEQGYQAGGATWDDDANALLATLAEAFERHLLGHTSKFFKDPIITTASKVSRKGAYIAPEACVGFSKEQRDHTKDRRLDPEAEYLWIKGTSLVHNVPTYVPAQLITQRRPEQYPASSEPMIRKATSIGLATWSTQQGSQLAAINELLEREAYMIMWFNQLSLPRIDLVALCSRHQSLAQHIKTCERYQLRIHAIQLLTDAPTHAVAVVVEDLSEHTPRFTIGLRAERSLVRAIDKALTEALRARRRYRLWSNAGNTWDSRSPVETIGHHDRLYYWSASENALHLRFLLQGPEIIARHEPWDHDSDTQHFTRLITWFKEKEFECVAIPLSTAGEERLPWYVTMVVAPQLQPTYLTEATRLFGGTRWKDVPRDAGYTPRLTPFADRPHPFS